MHHLLTLVYLQLKDKIDLGWLKERKSIIRNVIFFILKFVIITGATYILLWLCSYLGIFYYSESPNVMILVMTVSLLLSLISCTGELMKNLYFSEDNKVLITLPVNTNTLFISKIVVYYIYELKKSLSFLIPITLGCTLLLASNGCCSPFMCLWILIPLLFIVALPVMLGAVLSIPAMYIYRFFKRHSSLQILTFLLVLAALVWAAVTLIKMIPANIDLMNQWPTVRRFLREFLLNIEERLVPMRYLVQSLIGEEVIESHFALRIATVLRFLTVVGIDAILLMIVYLASRPLFFKMMAKNFEITKKMNVHGKNVRHSRALTFINKEFKINLRTISISVNYLMVYIIVPILILLLNALYKAMDTKDLGNILIYTFNVLLICLPFLASNSLIATYYSREGRTGYMKKVKPIYAFYPLFVKLIFNMLFSIPAVFVTAFIFGNSADLTVTQIIIFGFAVLFLHYGHMIWSAMLDVMNPQNEQYATTGVAVDNPNEVKSTGIAFGLAFVYAIIAYKFFTEANLYSNGYTMGFIKLLLVSLAILTMITVMFAKRVKAYYYEL